MGSDNSNGPGSPLVASDGSDNVVGDEYQLVIMEDKAVDRSIAEYAGSAELLSNCGHELSDFLENHIGTMFTLSLRTDPGEIDNFIERIVADLVAGDEVHHQSLVAEADSLDMDRTAMRGRSSQLRV